MVATNDRKVRDGLLDDTAPPSRVNPFRKKQEVSKASPRAVGEGDTVFDDLQLPPKGGSDNNKKAKEDAKKLDVPKKGRKGKNAEDAGESAPGKKVLQILDKRSIDSLPFDQRTSDS